MKTGWIFLLVAISGCSLWRPNTPKISEHADEVPAWAYSPLEGCDESLEMCASGEGRTGAQADANALKSLAAIFETRVEATTNSLMTMSANSATRQSQETAAVAVKEEVKQTLEAASIKQRHRHKGMSYSLASLDKSKASANLRAAIDRVQSELQGLWERKDRAAWGRMWELLITREGLNDRYGVMMGQRLSYEPSAALLQKWYQSRALTRSMGWENHDVPQALVAPLKAKLTEAGIALAPGATGERLKANWEAKQGFMNVKGFERWDFILTIEHLATDGTKKGVASVASSATGRTRVDCENKSKGELLKKLETELPKLNLKE